MKKRFILAILIGFFLVAMNAVFAEDEKNPVLQSGLIRIENVPKSSNLMFYIITEKGKKIPIISSSEQASSTNLLLRVDDKTYNLNKLSSVSYTVEATESVMKITYTLKDLAIVEATYAIISAEKNSIVDMTKVDYTIKNLSEKKHTFGIRSVFDFVLGESKPSHYTTAQRNSILSETIIKNMKDDQWIISSNGIEAVELLLYGKNVSPITKVMIANKDVLSDDSWFEYGKPGRSFNSLYSYNNSVVALFWDDLDLLPGKNVKKTFFMAYSLNDFQMAGRMQHGVISVDSGFALASVESEKPSKSATIATSSPLEELTKSDTVEDSPVDTIGTDSAKTEAPATVVENVIADNIQITQEQLDPVYVRDLLDRIKALEVDDTSINAEQLNKLKKELAAILKILRSRN